MMEVSLQDILEAREARVRQQQALLEKYRLPLVCFTMNIAGPVKTSSLIRRGFYAGLAQLDHQLPFEETCFLKTQELPTGCEAIFAVDAPAQELKAICTDIEENHPLGRLFDMDVIDTDGTKLERENRRGCIVCGAPGHFCAASRAHSVEQLRSVTTEMLTRYFHHRDPEWVAELAVRSLLDEVYTTPKPGLVDRRNNGSHQDMNLPLFEASAKALRPYFQRCVEIGQETAALSPEETFSHLRAAGIQAEDAMFHSTGGVNTHKGAIYAMGLLCGSIGRLSPVFHVDAILTECGNLVRHAVQQDFASATGKTAGERLYLRYGIRGIRGEAADGFPTVRNIALPFFRKALKDGHCSNDAGAVTLLHLIAATEDTNLYHRGGPEGAKWAAAAAKALLPNPSMEQILQLDDAFIERNLSPGGCADLLAVTYFLRGVAMNTEENIHPVFVYGTLMKGQRAAHMLEGSRFGGCFRLKDYAIYNLGRYPGIVPCEGETVQGELYFVSDEMLARMDEYEEEGSLYLRKKVTIWAGETSAAAEVYVYNRDITGCEKLPGAWK